MDPTLGGSLLVALIAFALPWWNGYRGIFMLDQSVVFDGGWRVLSGESPYRDFYAPFAPVTFFIQAFFFWIAGVNWTGAVLPACVLNVVAALSVVRSVNLLLGRRWVSLAAGLAVAITFQAPFGTLWIEQVSIFFNLLAFQAIAEALALRSIRSSYWLSAAGALSAIAILSKQNYGLFFTPVLMGMLLCGFSENWKQAAKAVAAFAAGGLAVVGGFALWVSAYSDWTHFRYYYFEMASRIGQARGSAAALVRALSLDVMPNRYQIGVVGIASGLAALLLVMGAGSVARWKWRMVGPAAVAAILLPLSHALTQVTTHNDYLNNLALPALAYVLGAGLIAFLFDVLEVRVRPESLSAGGAPPRRLVRAVTWGLIGAWGTVVLGYTAWIGWTRGVQQFPKSVTFGRKLQVPGLEQVRWGNPTEVAGRQVRAEDLENVSAHLRRKNERFFVMGDSTMLYGLHGVRPPQPLLYFIANHSFLPGETGELDGEIVSSLERNNVRIVVRETALHMENGADYQKFPRLWRWFETNFRLKAEYGIYQVWERS